MSKRCQLSCESDLIDSSSMPGIATSRNMSMLSATIGLQVLA